MTTILNMSATLYIQLKRKHKGKNSLHYGVDI